MTISILNSTLGNRKHIDELNPLQNYICFLYHIWLVIINYLKRS